MSTRPIDHPDYFPEFEYYYVEYSGTLAGVSPTGRQATHKKAKLLTADLAERLLTYAQTKEHLMSDNLCISKWYCSFTPVIGVKNRKEIIEDTERTEQFLSSKGF